MRTAMSPAELKASLKQLIVDTLRLTTVTPEQIDDAAPLFSPDEGLKLDSLAALELLTAIEFHFKIRFEDDKSAREHFRSVQALADFIGPKLPAS